MPKIICNKTFIPIRETHSHKSEQVSQLIYGETAEVIEKQDNWIKIATTFDNYEGWIEQSTVEYFKDITNMPHIITGFSRLIKSNNESIWLSTGSSIQPESLSGGNDNLVVQMNPELDSSDIIAIAEQFLGTPYLWGGRTFMGIDCSGLVQVCYKALNVALPRDASEQVKSGDNIQFLSHAQPGDLAFFDNEEGDISHVGIIKDSSSIIHASGSVKIEKLDQQGIYSKEQEKYTHKLRVVKRIK